MESNPKLVTEEEDLVVEIEDETVQDVQEVKTEEAVPQEPVKEATEHEDYSEKVQKRINKLTADRKNALEQAEAAIAIADNLKKQNEELSSRIKEVDNAHTSEYSARVETQYEQAKRMLKEGMDTGDTDKVVQAQESLSQLSIDKERLRIQKIKNEEPVEEEKAQPQQTAQQPPKYDANLQNWLSENKWFGSDEYMTNIARATHEKLISQGFDAAIDDPDNARGAQAYYAEIDKTMRQFFPNNFSDQQANVQPVAPASNGRSATKSNGRKKTVQLNPGQVAMAKKFNIPLEIMAKEVLKLEQKGN